MDMHRALPLMTASILVASLSAAHARPDTRAMTCKQAQTLVERSGGIVLNTGQRTYDRFVSSLRYCLQGEALRSRWVPTKDERNCFIGYSCEPPYNYDSFD